ncbi:MAG: metalloregulator ArsR/SmtB family transcription factor [Clostridia bacterium]|nr:metalloregulator ArsR/SmtB family transcription factor [Clostridia bacterium]
MKNLLNVLKCLSDVTRLRILNLLYEKELCVCDIMETLQITQAKASRHLTYLKNAGLVTDRKHAQWVYYSLIRDTENKFLDNLVFDNLRSLDQFLKDLQRLDDWIRNRKTHCT